MRGIIDFKVVKITSGGGLCDVRKIVSTLSIKKVRSEVKKKAGIKPALYKS
jgi:hypothetical protein